MRYYLSDLDKAKIEESINRKHSNETVLKLESGKLTVMSVIKHKISCADAKASE